MDHPSGPDRDPKRLLLVEDDVDQAHLVKYLLEADGTLTVTLAQDGLRAIRFLEESDWDLLITDINLPGADGIEVVEAAQRLRPGLPILATTGYTGPEYGARARERGADAVLIKPLDRDDLLHHIGILLARRNEGGEASPTLSDDSRGDGPPGAGPPESERSVLVLSVRPGDAEVGCGGAILAHIQRGDRVVLLHLARSPTLPGMIRTSGPGPGPVPTPVPGPGPAPGPAPGPGPEPPVASAEASGERPRSMSDPESDRASNRASNRASDEDREAIKAAGRRLGARTFITSLEDWGTEGQGELVRLVAGAIGELRPDVLYLPTARHPLPRHQTVNRAANEAAVDVPTILAYDPGDASPSFAPELFVPLGESQMEEKLRVTSGYGKWGIDRLQPLAIRASATFWARYADGSLAEGLEVIRASPDPLPFHSPPRHPSRNFEETE